MDTPELDRINTRDPTQRNRGNHRRSAQNSRMATASNTPRSHGHVQWTSSRDPSGQPSIATIPSWPLRKPSFHHYTLFYRVRVPFPPLQDPPPPSSPFAPPTLCTFLSVPSPSWPPRRPPSSMCSVRSLTSQRRPPWKGSSTHLQRRGSQSHHKHPTRRPQHTELVQGRWPAHRSHSQRVAHVGRKPTCSGYHFGITTHPFRGAQVTRKDLRRCSLTGCPEE